MNGIGPDGGGFVSNPVITYFNLVKALKIASGKTTVAGVPAGGAAISSWIKDVVAAVKEAGSITAAAVATIPLVPGGGGFIFAPGVIIN